jgi:RNA polymerase sigma factor (TIGR02999 family)
VRVADNPPDITILLRQWHEGDLSARDMLFVLLLPKLKEIAASRLRRERPNHTMQRTDLMIEAYFRLEAANRKTEWRDRGHFFAISTLAMGRLLIDHARRRPTAELLSLEDLPDGIMAGRNRLEVVLIVDQLMDELEQEQPDIFKVVVARMYMGYDMKEIAEMYGMPLRSVERRWHIGRKWLFQRLKKEE